MTVGQGRLVAPKSGVMPLPRHLRSNPKGWC